MGCSCGKARTERRSTSRSGWGTAPTPAPPEPTPQGKQQPQTVGSTQTFSLLRPDGSSESFGSKLEADAARVRNGYRGRVITG